MGLAVLPALNDVKNAVHGRGVQFAHTPAQIESSSQERWCAEVQAPAVKGGPLDQLTALGNLPIVARKFRIDLSFINTKLEPI